MQEYAPERFSPIAGKANWPILAFEIRRRCGPPLRAFSLPPAGDAYFPGPGTPSKQHCTANKAEKQQVFHVDDQGGKLDATELNQVLPSCYGFTVTLGYLRCCLG